MSRLAADGRCTRFEFRRGRLQADQPMVDAFVFRDHHFGREALLELAPASLARASRFPRGEMRFWSVRSERLSPPTRFPSLHTHRRTNVSN